MQFEPVRTGSEDAGGTWEVWEHPYWDAAAKLRSVAPVASERVAGVPSLTGRATGGLVGGVPACLVVDSSRRRATKRSAGRPYQALAQTLPCSAPNAGVLPKAKDALLRAQRGSFA